MALVLALCCLMQSKEPVISDSAYIPVAANAALPSLALDPDGNPCIAFVQNGNIAVSVSPDGGKTFLPPAVAIDARGRAPLAAPRGPRIAIDRQKRIYVTAPLNLNPNPEANTGDANELYLVTSNDKGKTFSKPVQINETPKAALQSAHSIAAGSDSLHVAWIESKPGKGAALHYSKFSGEGKRTSGPKVLAPFTCDRCPPGLAVNAQGNPIVAYREGLKDGEKTSTRRVLTAYSPSGGSGFPPFSLASSVESGHTDCIVDTPAVAISADSKLFGIAWVDARQNSVNRDVWWTYGALGKLPREYEVHHDRRFYQGRPTLAFDAEGVLWCAWEDGARSTQRIFIANNKVETDIPNIQLGNEKEPRGACPSLASSGAKVAIAYQAGNDVGFRMLR